MLKEKISSDLKESLKTGDSFRSGVLRMIISVFQNKEIEKRGAGKPAELTEEEVVEILIREAKKRKEAAEIYAKGGRDDLSQKEIREIELIKKYLPEQLSEQEIEKIVKATIEKIGAKDIKEFGRAMAEAMKELKGKADAKLVSDMVKKLLSS